MHSTGISVIGIVVLIFVLPLMICLVVGAIYAVVRVGKTRGAAAAIGLAVGLLALPVLGLGAVASLFFVARAEVVHLNRELQEAESSAIAPSHDDLFGEPPATGFGNVETVYALPDPPPTNWASSTDLGEFQASLYPGIVECAEPLAQQVAEVLQQQEFSGELDEAGQHEGIRFLIRIDEGDFGYPANQFLGAFMKSLRTRFPRAEWILQTVVPDEAMTLESGEASLTFSAQVERIESASWEPSVESPSGDVTCQINTDGNTTSVKVRFADKPWVTRFDEVVSKIPNRQFVVGYSSELASTEAQARQSALENVRSQVDVENWNGARMIIADEHVVDRFAQKLSRPYGDVWREAVLVDLTGERVQETVRATMAEARGQSTTKRLTVLIASLLVLATVVVCFLVNVLTQGYYQKPINRSAVTLIVLVVLGGLLLLGLNVA